MARVVIIGPYTKSLLGFRGDLIKEMVGNGHDVITMAPETGYEEGLQAIGAKFYSIPLERAGINPYKDINLTIYLFKLLKETKPDILFVYTVKPVVYGTIAGRIIGINNIYSMITGLGSIFIGERFPRNLIKYVIMQLYKFSLQMSKKIFFQNPDDLGAFVSLHLVKEEKAILVNGSGVNIEEYRYIEPKKGTISFLLIARLIRDKGIVEFVEAARLIKKHYHEVSFKVLGPYDTNPTAVSRKEIEAWIEEGTIEYLGETNDVRPFIAESSVYVLPSYREGTPRSVLEAMSMGRPIITTDAPGCRETVKDGFNGFLVPIKDRQSLADAMERFILEPELIPVMGLRSRQIAVEKYDVRKVNQNILKAMSLEAE